MLNSPLVVEPVTLESEHTRLEPLAMEHHEGLSAVSADPAVFRYMTFDDITGPGRLCAWMEVTVREPEKGISLPFAIIDKATGAVAGCTSYCDIAAKHRWVEIGRTWLGTAYQRTALNTECKYLLLRHAFEILDVNRVQIKTDGRNLKSQAAIERIGAKREGILRANTILPDGYVRDTVMYSVVASEWPDVKTHLESKMARYNSADLR